MKNQTGREITCFGRVKRELKRRRAQEDIPFGLEEDCANQNEEKIKKQKTAAEQIGAGFAGKLGKLNSQDWI